jgi:hypothetical protein
MFSLFRKKSGKSKDKEKDKSLSSSSATQPLSKKKESKLRKSSNDAQKTKHGRGGLRKSAPSSSRDASATLSGTRQDSKAFLTSGDSKHKLDISVDVDDSTDDTQGAMKLLDVNSMPPFMAFNFPTTRIFSLLHSFYTSVRSREARLLLPTEISASVRPVTVTRCVELMSHLCSVLINTDESHIAPYKILDTAGIVAAQQDDINGAAELLDVSVPFARTLLMHFQWDLWKLTDVFFDRGRDQVYKVRYIAIMLARNCCRFF